MGDAAIPRPGDVAAGVLLRAQGLGKRFVTGEGAVIEVLRGLDLEVARGERLAILGQSGIGKSTLLHVLALLTPASLLLIDEPFEGLDLRQSREIAAALRAEAASGRTLFLSIHQMADAARVCDRFVLLSGGVVKGAGTLEELSATAASHGQSGARDLEEVFLALT